MKIQNVIVVSMVLGLAGCGANVEENDVDVDVGFIESDLVAGTWVNPPGNGVQSGSSGGAGPLAVCRANYDNGQHPGKVWEGRCNFGWGGKARRATTYKVLLANGYSWTNPLQVVTCDSSGNCLYNAPLPNNAVDGGDAGDAAGHSRLGVCQARWNGTWHPGKYFKEKCNIPLGGTNADPTGGDSEEKALAPNTFGEVLVLVK